MSLGIIWHFIHTSFTSDFISSLDLETLVLSFNDSFLSFYFFYFYNSTLVTLFFKLPFRVLFYFIIHESFIKVFVVILYYHMSKVFITTAYILFRKSVKRWYFTESRSRLRFLRKRIAKLVVWWRSVREVGKIKIHYWLEGVVIWCDVEYRVICKKWWS